MSPASDDESDDDGGGGEAATDGSRRTRGSGSRSQNQDGAWFGDRRARPGDGVLGDGWFGRGIAGGTLVGCTTDGTDAAGDVSRGTTLSLDNGRRWDTGRGTASVTGAGDGGIDRAAGELAAHTQGPGAAAEDTSTVTGDS